MDLAVFTTYPYFDYPNPNDIPTGYYVDINQYIDKPVAFSEIGWMSRTRYGDDLSYLNDRQFTGSQEEQVQFLKVFKQRTTGMDLEFVNWAFLNDIQEWQDGDRPEQNELFDSIGLKKHNGEAKSVWFEWLNY